MGATRGKRLCGEPKLEDVCVGSCSCGCAIIVVTQALTLKGSLLDRVLHWGLMLCGHCLATFTFNHCRNYLKIIKEDNFKNNFTIPNVTFEFIS